MLVLKNKHNLGKMVLDIWEGDSLWIVCLLQYMMEPVSRWLLVVNMTVAFSKTIPTFLDILFISHFCLW